jgi:mono/diheme cytochrome c family protein
VRDVEEIAGRVVVAGIPGAGAVASVGAFHAGGPIHDRPAFHVLTEPGMVLDPGRILVASTSNVGAPLAPNGQPPGSILSIDARGGSTIVVAPDFATAGGQAAADDGRVVLLTANSPEFLNRVYNPGAVTAHLASVAVPMAISINNAFGRIWFANMPGGIARDGYESIVDPDGRPLNGAPSTIAGGIFSGASTNREPQLLRGAMSTGAVATALLGRSPDGSGRAVFAVLNADGSLVQIHVEKGVDGLSPPGTVTLASGSRRAGMVFNWVPDPILYVTDAGANAIVALTLRRDGHVFRTQSMRSITAAAFDEPVDLAPAIAEIASDEFSSNTTLAGDADLYVVNRGSGTVARVKQSGTVVAVRRVTLPQVGVLGAHRLNGIAVSPDARFLWLTITGRLPGLPEGAVIEIPAFGAPEIEEGTLRDRGAVVFARTLTPAEGLGPLFNRESCVACHEYGGMGPGGLGTATRVGRLTARGFDPMIGEGGPIARARSVGDAGAPCDLSAGIPSGVNVISVRNAPDLRGTGTIDAIPDEEIVAGAVPRGDDVHGRVHRVRGADGRERVGRFGWKAETATLLQFVADAFRNELGITSPLAPTDILPAGRPGRLSCAGESDRVEDDGSMVYAVTAFLRSLPPHQPRHSGLQGAALFNATGCSACHTPSLAVGGRRAWLYSDLLLHDVGPTLDDKVVQGDARGRDWRTTPLWGLGHRARLLHDGRARTITEAIDAHGGEAEAARARFQALSAGQRRALLAFLGGL